MESEERRYCMGEELAISFPGAHPMAHGVFSRRGARGASHSDAEGCDGRDGTLDHQSISSLWRAKSVVTVWGRSWRSHSLERIQWRTAFSPVGEREARRTPTPKAATDAMERLTINPSLPYGERRASLL